MMMGISDPMEWLVLFSDFAAGSVRVIVCLILISSFLKADKLRRKGAAAGAAGMLALALLQGFFPVPEMYCLALEAGLTAVCAVRFQKADMRMSLFVSIFFEIAVGFWQFLLSAWEGVLFHSADFLNPATWSGLSAVWVTHILLIVLGWRCGGEQGRQGKVWQERNRFRAAGIIALIGFFALITLSEQTVLEIPDDTMDMWMILAVVLLMAVLLFNLNRQYRTEKELAEVKSAQAEMLEHDYNSLNHAYAANAKLFHDFHNHIGILRRLLEQREYEKAAAYLDELQGPVKEMEERSWIGDDAIDYLINSKRAAAEEKGILFRIQAEYPKNAGIRSADLCAVLGNLLDNALEASEQVTEKEERFIKLTIRRINQMVVIKVENSFRREPVLENGILKTTKNGNTAGSADGASLIETSANEASGGLHGWGLKSAQTAAEKYDGMVQTSYEEHIFRAVVTMSCREVQRDGEQEYK